MAIAQDQKGKKTAAKPPTAAKKKAASKQEAAQETPGKNGTATSIVRGAAEIGGAIVTVKELGEIITNVLMQPGWQEALTKLGHFLNSIPMAGFMTLAQENTSRDTEIAQADYDRWINSILLTLANIQARSAELREEADKFGIRYEDIGELVAQRLIRSAGTGNSVEYAELEKIIRNTCFYWYLEKTLPPKIAQDITKKLKL